MFCIHGLKGLIFLQYPKWIYMFNTMPIDTPVAFFFLTEIGKKIYYLYGTTKGQINPEKNKPEGITTVISKCITKRWYTKHYTTGVKTNSLCSTSSYFIYFMVLFFLLIPDFIYLSLLSLFSVSLSVPQFYLNRENQQKQRLRLWKHQQNSQTHIYTDQEKREGLNC